MSTDVLRTQDLGTTHRRALLHLAGLRDERDQYPLAFDVAACEALCRYGLTAQDGYPNHRITPAGIRMAQDLLSDVAAQR